MSSNSNVKNTTANFHQQPHNTPVRDQATLASTLQSTILDKDCSDSDEISNQSSIDNGVNSANGTNESSNNVINSAANNLSDKETKVEKIRDSINQCLSDKSKKKISSIINNVVELTDIEKVYLYLNLPTSSSQEVDNSKISKGAGNPFGKKADVEVSQTYIWIASHLEEDVTVSLPKHEVYDEYKSYCDANSSQPLCVADFGKAMKHMFPNVKPRRLGQRGNSRYCYSGLRKKINFEKPELPDLYRENAESSKKNDEELVNRVKSEEDNDQLFEERLNALSSDENLVLSASSHIILEWARKEYSLKFDTIKDLARHLIELNYIDKESMAALTVIASDENCNDDLSELTRAIGESSDNLSFKKLLTTDHKKQVKKKEQIKLMTKKPNEQSSSKVGKVSKGKKNRMKKLKPIASKIKLESFDNLTFQVANQEAKDETVLNPIEINKTKNCELGNQFSTNTQPVDSSNAKRRHSTIGFECNYGRITLDQVANSGGQIVDDTNYKYQMKRQTSEKHFTLSKKRNLNKLNPSLQRNSNGFSVNKKLPCNYYTPNQANDLISVQSTNYLNESTVKNNQLVSYKKYFEIDNRNKLNHDNLLQQQIDSGSRMKIEESNMMSVLPINSMNQTISTQVNEQELYQFDGNVFEESNQRAITYETIYPTNTPKTNQLINYSNEPSQTNPLSNMCNVNTQMPSVPPSPINQKDNPFANQLSNQMMNDKVDFNNNISAGLTYSTFNSLSEEQQLNCQVNNQIHQATNQSTKLFVNPINPQNLINKNNNRSLNRVRHSSGPSHTHSSMLYTGNSNFVPMNNSLTNIRSNSLSPLYENCVDNLNQKMNNFNCNNFANTSNTNSTIVKFSSNPVSPVSEPMSPNFNSFFDNKKQQLHNLHFSHKLSNPNTLNNQAKKDGSRSASFTSSNESFAFAGRTRHRHMSSPYIGTMMANSSSNNNNNFSYSSQSLTNSPTAQPPFNSGGMFAQNAINPSMNQAAAINQQSNLQPENNYSLVTSDYELPPSPPLSSNLLNETEKAFKKKTSGDLVSKNNLLQQEEWTNQAMMNMNLQQNQSFNQSNAIQSPTLRTLHSTMQHITLGDHSIQPVDDLQTTLQDLKDCDKDFSKFF